MLYSIHILLSASSSFFGGGVLLLQSMEVPKLGIKSEPQLLAYTTATAMRDPKCVCKLHCSLWQCHILNPLNEARDQTRILKDTSQVLNLLSHNGNPLSASSEIKKKKKM